MDPKKNPGGLLPSFKKSFLLAFFYSWVILAQDDISEIEIPLNNPHTMPFIDWAQEQNFLPETLPQNYEIIDLRLAWLKILGNTDRPPVLTEELSNRFRHESFSIKSLLKKHASALSFSGLTLAFGAASFLGPFLYNQLAETCNLPEAILLQGIKFVDYESLIDFIDCTNKNNFINQAFSYVNIIGLPLAISAATVAHDYFFRAFQSYENHKLEGILKATELYKTLELFFLELFEKRIAFLHHLFFNDDEILDNSNDAFFNFYREKSPAFLDGLIDSKNPTCLKNFSFTEMNSLLANLNYIKAKLPQEIASTLTGWDELRNLIREDNLLKQGFDKIIAKKNFLLFDCNL